MSAQLLGLQGLKGMTLIEGVNVVGGTTDHINLNINGNYPHSFPHEILSRSKTVTIHNPSNLNLSANDLSRFRTSALEFY